MDSPILIVLAPGFEEIEALGTADILRRLGFAVTLAALKNDKFVPGSHQINLTADATWAETDPAEFAAIILPGGMPGARTLQQSAELREVLLEFAAAGKLVGAICAAPIALGAAGLLKNRRYTVYPGFEREIPDGNYTGNQVEVDGKLITGNGPGAVFAFAAQIAAALGKSDESDEILEQMMYK